MKTQKTRWSQLSAMLYFATAISLLSSVKGQCSQSGITLTGTSGNVSSPSYPSNYPNRQTCRWIITVPQGYLVRLSFEVFQLETCAVPSPVCSCDHVEVRDGRDGSSKQLGRYCGNDQPSPVHSSGRFMWMEFDTDLTGNEKGFLANFIAVAIPTSLSTSAAAPGLCSNPKHPPSCSNTLNPVCCYNNGPSCCQRGGNRCSDETEITRDYCPRSSDEPSKTACCFVDGKPSCCNQGSYCHGWFGWDISNSGCIGATVGILIAVILLVLVICLCCCFGPKNLEWCCLPFVMCYECCDQTIPNCQDCPSGCRDCRCSFCGGNSCKGSSCKGSCRDCNCCDGDCCDGDCCDGFCGGCDCDGGGDCC
ncbi:uncharacterized protein LOC144642360 [Oculina patagonica]